MKINSHNFLEKAIIELVFFDDQDFGAIDTVATEFFYLAVLNSIVFIYFLFSKSLFKTRYTGVIYPILAYFIYCIVAGISILFSININESLITLNQEVIFLFTMFNVYLLLNSLEKNIDLFLLYTLSIILTFEIIAVYKPILNDLIIGRDLFRSNDYKGLAGNINITTFSILCKIPILIFLKIKYSKKLNLLIEFLFNSLIEMDLYNEIADDYLGSILISIVYLTYLFYSKNFKNAILVTLLFITTTII